ncbi:hypothetical protein ACFY7C_11790 [Streptomyces sp. NPDC012769]|uniref:hypothetical protein n=1 Tax=Streptomyces sp. NPDC012769 TaxID=3364848 RepID=UPI00367C3D28
MRDTRCKTCGSTKSAEGIPTMIVALAGSEDVYACTEHAALHAAPPGNLAVALAQLQDIMLRLYEGQL